MTKIDGFEKSLYDYLRLDEEMMMEPDRVKGRDFFDFERYVKNDTRVNKAYLVNNLCREGVVSSPDITENELLTIISNRFNVVDYDSAVSDLRSFVRDDRIPDVRSPEHFRELSKKTDVLLMLNRPRMKIGG